MRHLSSFVAGLIFAIGLALGGMTDPNKVIGFLDITGDWDPSLAFVMGGAILVYAPAYRLIVKRPAPRFGDRFHLPTRRDIEPRLVIGAALFGIGWGLGGFCPGPAIVSMMSFTVAALVFGSAMLISMAVYAAMESR